MPYCKLGTIAQPNNPALRKKTLKHHLKTCAKAPKGCTLKMFYTARMKKEGGVCLGDSTVHREKMIQGIWKKADEKAKDLRHEPLDFSVTKAKLAMSFARNVGELHPFENLESDMRRRESTGLTQ